LSSSVPSSVSWKLFLSILLILFTMAIGSVCIGFNEGWTIVDSVYWSFITSTTIGYGDLSLTKDSSLLFSFFYILLSTTFVAFGLNNMKEVFSEIQAEKRLRIVMAKHLQLNEKLASDLSGGETISSGEYLAGFLLEMGRVTTEDVLPVLRRFDDLDADSSGFLDSNDLDPAVIALKKAGQLTKQTNKKYLRGIPEDGKSASGSCCSLLMVALSHLVHLCLLGGYLVGGAAFMRECETISYPCADAIVLEVEGNLFTQDDVPQCSRQWTWLEGMYFSVLTLTTVGYGDYAPSTDNGKIFVMCYAFVGLGFIMHIIIHTGGAFCRCIEAFFLRVLVRGGSPSSLASPRRRQHKAREHKVRTDSVHTADIVVAETLILPIPGRLRVCHFTMPFHYAISR
jgi:voltage-gated potassium channel Kch